MNNKTMSLLEYNEITEGRIIVLDDEPYEVISSHTFRMQQRKPQNVTKLKSLINGRVREETFHVSDKVEEADLEKRDIKFIYSNRGENWFSELNDPSKRFKLDIALIGDPAKFLKNNMTATALVFNEKIITVKLPIKLALKVVEAPPAVKGDTAKGGNKTVKLENGAEINAPLFINEGDTIVVNTETGEYVERA